jgi:hypothetical protein
MQLAAVGEQQGLQQQKLVDVAVVAVVVVVVVPKQH